MIFLSKAGVEAGSVVKEFAVTPEKLAELKVGEVLSVEMFAVGQKVDVSGTTLGKGFSGVINHLHLTPGDCISGDQVESSTPGQVPTY